MEAKHTPGPWTVAEHHGAIDVMGVGSGVCRVFTDPNQNSLPTMQGARANARLIAAAPDLLRERDALKVERDALLAALRATLAAVDAVRALPMASPITRDDVDRALIDGLGGYGLNAARAAMRAATSGSGVASDVASASARATGGAR